MALIKKQFSLRTRLFLAMIFLVLLACLLILGATFFQYQNEAEDYNVFRLDRKESQVQRQLDFLAEKHKLYSTDSIRWGQYTTDLNAITKIHKVEFSLFDLKGNPLFVSFLPLKVIANNYRLNNDILNNLAALKGKRFLEKNEDEIGKFQSSYSYLKDASGTPYAILFFPYFEDISFAENELKTFLQRLYQIYLIMMVISIFFALFLSRLVTSSLEKLRAQMDRTGLLQRNEKIYLKNATSEINSLVVAYNKMVDDLEASAAQLAKVSRDEAWQEMARQVAHEIKNPLTPMRLTVQSFQRNFNVEGPQAQEKMGEFASILIEQIDTMSEVANTFSTYATLPKAKLEPCDIVEVTKRSTEIFDQNMVSFESDVAQLEVPLDRTQWIRVMTNLIQNGIQSVPAKRSPKIEITLTSSPTVSIRVADNGSGIPKALKGKVFEPRFTTKTKGMGLGLGIVRNIIQSHNGTITYTKNKPKGTIFEIQFN